MSLDAVIMLCGALVAILPFLGFPIAWDDVFYVILGVIVLLLGIAVRRNVHKTQAELKRERQRHTPPTTFTESSPREEIHEERRPTF